MDIWTKDTSRRTVIGVAAASAAAGIDYAAASAPHQCNSVRSQPGSPDTSLQGYGFCISVKDPPFNAIGDGNADDTEAFNKAISAVGSSGIGGTILIPAGTYLVKNMDALPDSVSLIGCAMFEQGHHRCVIKYRGSQPCLRVTSRNIVKNIRLEGPATDIPNYTSAAGIGIHIQGGYHRLENVWIWGFACGMRIDEAYWCNYYGCVYTYNIRNIEFDSKSYSTTQMFIGCTISLAQKEGLRGRATPVRNIAIQFFGGSIESNVQDNSSVAQIMLGSVGNLMFSGAYFEDTKPQKSTTLDLTGAGEVTIDNCYFNGGAKHIRSDAHACSYISIRSCRFLGTSDPLWSIDLADCENVVAFSNEVDGKSRIDGVGSVTLDDGVLVRGQHVLGKTASGWARDVGLPKRTSNTSYTAPKISKVPTQMEVQAIADAVQDMSRTIKALKDDLYMGAGTHGLIGP